MIEFGMWVGLALGIVAGIWRFLTTPRVKKIPGRQPDSALNWGAVAAAAIAAFLFGRSQS